MLLYVNNGHVVKLVQIRTIVQSGRVCVGDGRSGGRIAEFTVQFLFVQTRRRIGARLAAQFFIVAFFATYHTRVETTVRARFATHHIVTIEPIVRMYAAVVRFRRAYFVITINNLKNIFIFYFILSNIKNTQIFSSFRDYFLSKYYISFRNIDNSEI